MTESLPITIHPWDQTNGYTFDITREGGLVETHKFIGFVPGDLTSFYTELIPNNPDSVSSVNAESKDKASKDNASEDKASEDKANNADIEVKQETQIINETSKNLVNSILTNSTKLAEINKIVDELTTSYRYTYTGVDKDSKPHTIEINLRQNGNYSYKEDDENEITITKEDLITKLTQFSDIKFVKSE